MIYEMRTDTFVPGGNADHFEKLFGEVIDYRNTFSRIGAFWKADIGPLNQIIHIWPYESLQQRAEVRVASTKEGKYPPRGIQGLLGEDVEILTPAPFMRPWGEVQELGNIYEVRTYEIRPGSTSEMIKRWGECLPYREKLSPLAACWYTDIGVQQRWIHAWPYASLEERMKIRAEVKKDPQWHWPPPTQDLILRMESRIMVPAPFSTMR